MIRPGRYGSPCWASLKMLYWGLKKALSDKPKYKKKKAVNSFVFAFKGGLKHFSIRPYGINNKVICRLNCCIVVINQRLSQNSTNDTNPT